MLYYVHVDMPLKRAIIHLETCGHTWNREKMAVNGYWNIEGFTTLQEAIEFGKAEGMKEVRDHNLRSCVR